MSNIGLENLKALLSSTVIQTETYASTALYDGQASVTATAAALPSQAIREVVLTSDPTNTSGSYIYIGDSTSQHTPLAPGQSATLSIDNLDLVYAYASTGTLKLNYLARN